MIQESPIVPTIGRNVLYVLNEGIHAGETKAAIITRVWPGSSSVNLTVFPDLANDEGAERFACSVAYDPDGTQPRTWHWHPIQLSNPQSPCLTPPEAAPVADSGTDLPSEPATVEAAADSAGGESPGPDTGSPAGETPAADAPADGGGSGGD